MPKPLLHAIAIGVGGLAGALARHYVTEAFTRLFGGPFPVGTMIVNLSGCFVLGWFITATGEQSETLRLAVAVGFLGAYTTFSTLMYHSAWLLERSLGWHAILNVVGSVGLGLLAVWGGVWCGKKF